ncbi:hypothetical protein THAOC_23847, partial [Thalassiosira oceanica]
IRRMEANRVAALHRRRTLVAQRRLASGSDPAPASSSSSFSQYEDSEQASRDDEEMATMILPHRPVPPTPDQSRRTEANSDGMSIGPGETFEKAVVHFAEGRMANIPGLMLTAFTRVKNAGDLAIGTDSNSLAVETITYKDRYNKSISEKEGLPRTAWGPITAIYAAHRRSHYSIGQREHCVKL